jgi:hypothetical protein
VDPGHQGLAQTFDRLFTEPPPQQGRDRLVGGARAAGEEEVHSHADLSRPREEAAAQEGQDAGGNRQHHAFGQRVQAATVKDEDRASHGAGRNQAAGETESAAQREPFGFLGQDRVGPASMTKPSAVSADHAGGGPPLQEHVVPGLVEVVAGAPRCRH